MTPVVSARMDSGNYRISTTLHGVAPYLRQNAAAGGPRLSQIKRPSELIAGGEPMESREVEIYLPNDGQTSGIGREDNSNWEWARHSPALMPTWPAHPEPTDATANAFYVDGHAATVRHNGEDMVGVNEVPSSEILQKCRMFVY